MVEVVVVEHASCLRDGRVSIVSSFLRVLAIPIAFCFCVLAFARELVAEAVPAACTARRWRCSFESMVESFRSYILT